MAEGDGGDAAALAGVERRPGEPVGVADFDQVGPPRGDRVGGAAPLQRHAVAAAERQRQAAAVGTAGTVGARGEDGVAPAGLQAQPGILGQEVAAHAAPRGAPEHRRVDDVRSVGIGRVEGAVGGHEEAQASSVPSFPNL